MKGKKWNYKKFIKNMKTLFIITSIIILFIMYCRYMKNYNNELLKHYDDFLNYAESQNITINEENYKEFTENKLNK